MLVEGPECGASVPCWRRMRNCSVVGLLLWRGWERGGSYQVRTLPHSAGLLHRESHCVELLGDVLKSELRNANGMGEVWLCRMLLRVCNGRIRGALKVYRGWRRENALIETARLI